jgi:hypothetical protein
VFPDEGHGFAPPQNNIARNAVAKNFLAKCPGSRASRSAPSLEASTAQVRCGAEFGSAGSDAWANMRFHCDIRLTSAVP